MMLMMVMVFNYVIERDPELVLGQGRGGTVGTSAVAGRKYLQCALLIVAGILYI